MHNRSHEMRVALRASSGAVVLGAALLLGRLQRRRRFRPRGDARAAQDAHHRQF